jgi:hypothetical protein
MHVYSLFACRLGLILAKSQYQTMTFSDPVISHFLKAYNDPATVTLSQEVNLPLPIPSDRFPGLSGHMNRLVTTGKDTPENIALWFGPRWQGFEYVRKNA